MRYLLLVLLLCGCPAANNTRPAEMTTDQQSAYAEDLKAVLDEVERQADEVNAGAEARALYADIARDIDAELRTLWLDNASSSKSDRRRLMLNRLRERDRELDKAVANAK